MTALEQDYYGEYDESRALNGQPDDEPAPGASYQPINLGPYLRGEIRAEPPAIGLCRADGVRLLYRGKAHVVFGEMECGKSWLGLLCALAELDAGNHVAYLHFEEADPSGTVERLLALGLSADVIEQRFHFAGPDEPCSCASYLAALMAAAPSLVLLDGVNEAMDLNRMDTNATAGATAFRSRFMRPFTARGAAVLAMDHVVKDTSARGRSQMGSIHKGNGIEGCLISLENMQPFGRGMKGVTNLYVTKDRPGHLRSKGRPVPKQPAKVFMGQLVIDDTISRRAFTGGLDAVWYPPKAEQDGGVPPDGDLSDSVSACATEIIRVLQRKEGQRVDSLRELGAALRAARHKFGDKKIKIAVDDLIFSKTVDHGPAPRGATWLAIPETTAADDPQ